MATKTKSQTSAHIKITKSNAWIRRDDGIEIPVSKSWVRQYVEYMLATNQEVTIEAAP